MGKPASQRLKAIETMLDILSGKNLKGEVKYGNM